MQFQFIARACHTQRALLQRLKSRYPWLRFSSRISFDRKLSESYFVGLWIKQRVLNYRIELQKKRLESAEERARARASSACAQTPSLLCMIKVVQLKSMENVLN